MSNLIKLVNFWLNISNWSKSVAIGQNLSKLCLFIWNERKNCHFLRSHKDWKAFQSCFNVYYQPNLIFSLLLRLWNERQHHHTVQGLSKAKPLLHIMSPPCQRSSHMLSNLRTYWPFKTYSDVVQTESKMSCTWLWLLLL